MDFYMYEGKAIGFVLTATHGKGGEMVVKLMDI